MDKRILDVFFVFFFFFWGGGGSSAEDRFKIGQLCTNRKLVELLPQNKRINISLKQTGVCYYNQKSCRQIIPGHTMLKKNHYSQFGLRFHHRLGRCLSETFSISTFYYIDKNKKGRMDLRDNQYTVVEERPVFFKGPAGAYFNIEQLHVHPRQGEVS